MKNKKLKYSFAVTTVLLMLTSAYATNSKGTVLGDEKTFATQQGSGSPQTVTDIDANIYKTVKIGKQVWMTENLKVTKYPNGNPILKVTDNTTWGGLFSNNTNDAYCYYNNNDVNADTYGSIYTYATAIGVNWTKDDKDGLGVCSDDWHLPTDAEWKQLEMKLGMSQSNSDNIGWCNGVNIATLLKSTSGWNSNDNGINSSSFSVLSDGCLNDYSDMLSGAGTYGTSWALSLAALTATTWIIILSETETP
jgi:uncharacterized protein (TIGR02145 family)